MPARFYKAIKNPGSIEDLKVKIWRAVCAAEEVLKAADCAEETIRAVHALIQAGREYAKILVNSELEERLKAIEAAINAKQR